MSESILKIIIEVSLLSSAAMLLVLAVRGIIGARLRTRWTLLLWTFVLVRLLLPVTMNSPVHFVNVWETVPHSAAVFEPYNEGAAVSSAAPDTAFAADAYAPDAEGETEATVQVQQPAAEAAVQVQSVWAKIRVWGICFAVWLTGAAFFFAYHLYRLAAFRRKTAGGREITDPHIRRLLEQNSEKLGIKRRIKIVECEMVSVPGVMGVFRSVVLLPKGLADAADAQKLEMVFLHELCHVKRRDLIKRYVWLIARTLHWFNPLVWIAYRAYMDDVETACDEMAMRQLSQEGVCTYSQALVEVVKSINRKAVEPVSISLCKNKSKLGKRVENMMKPKRKTMGATIAAVLLICVMAFACFTSACSPMHEVQEEAADVPGEATSEMAADKQQAEDTDTTMPDQELASDTVSDSEVLEPERLKAAEEAVCAYKLRTDEVIMFEMAIDHYGDQILWFFAENYDTMYQLLASDLSFVAIENKETDCTVALDLTDAEASNALIEYAKEYWPQKEIIATKIEHIEFQEVPHQSYSVEGTLVSKDGTEETFYGGVNGQGQLYHIKRIPAYDIDASIAEGTALSLDEATKAAVEWLKEEVAFVNPDDITVVEAKLDTEYANVSYWIEIEYRTDVPTVSEYDFDAEVQVIPSTGRVQSRRVVPILDNIDVIPLNEAEKIAIAFLVEETGIDENQLTAENISNVDTYNGLMYWFSFDTGSKTYTILVDPESGTPEIGGISH